MFSFSCPTCNKTEIPVADGTIIDGQMICPACYAARDHADDERQGRKVIQLANKEHCAMCGKHRDEVPLKDMSGSPICVHCSETVISRPFPVWVKAFMAGVFVLVAFSIFWNWRFFQGYAAIERVKQGMEIDDMELMISASKDAFSALPELEDVANAAHYFRGIELLQQDSAQTALDEFDLIYDKTGENWDATSLRTRARISLTFDNKDYDAFHMECRKLYDMVPNDPGVIAGLASSFACLYAVSADSSLRDSALYYLDASVAIQPPDTAQQEYVARIQHRLATREIIDRETYLGRYPHGYTITD